MGKELCLNPQTGATSRTLCGEKDMVLSLHVLMPPYNKIRTSASHSLLYDPMFLECLLTFRFKHPRPKVVGGTYSLTSKSIEKRI